MNECNPPHVFADFVVSVPGLHRNRPAVCRATGICRGGDKSIVVILAECKHNPGASVTNLAEVFAYYAAVGFGVPLECVMWIEHYPRHGPNDETFHLIEFGPHRDTQRPDSLGPATWHPFSRAKLEHMLGCELSELFSVR
jgi:hypothetical protein